MAGRPASAHWRAQGEGSRREGTPSPRPLGLGRPERGARVGSAGPGGLTPGQPAARRATAALAQAAGPSGRVTAKGCLGQRTVAGVLGASPQCWGPVVLCGGGSGVTTLPGEVGEGRQHSWPARGGVTEAKCVCIYVCVRTRAWGWGGRARAEEEPGPARRREQRAGPELWKEAGGEWGRWACGRAGGLKRGAEGGGGGEPRRRRRARAFRGRRIRACARRRSVRVKESDACAFTCARESGKKRREA